MKVWIVGCVIAAVVSASAEAVKVKFLSDTQRNYEKRTRVVAGDAAGEGNDFVVTCVLTSKCETAWRITSERMSVPAGTGGYAFDFEIYADADWLKPSSSDSWGSAVTWYDRDGRKIFKEPVSPKFRKKVFSRFRFSGKAPGSAAFATVEIGVDGPNLPPGEKVVVRNAVFTAIPQGSEIPAEIVYDVVAPLVYSRFSSPSTDSGLLARYEIKDDGEIDWNTVVVSNTQTKAQESFSRVGNIITLTPSGPWTKGIHTFVISVKDKAGNATVSRKTFLIGENPRKALMTLRDDGVVLIGGKPFFPIGIYGVKKDDFNAHSFDRAAADLKAAGFNTLHSYSGGRKDEFMDAVAKHGLYSWTYAFKATEGDSWLVEKARSDKTVLAWYTGDDTSMYISPSELLDRHEAVYMLDGTRLSCQADVTGGDQTVSRYQPFVAFSDIFLPELYHVYSNNPENDRGCVATVIRDMEKVKDDIAKYGEGKPKSIWPILQFFHGGRYWKRFPTVDELYGMSFAALIHGGHGITWFHYAGKIDREKGRRYSGAYRTPEDWVAMTNLSSRIASLAPVFLERTPPQPASPEILEGDKTDKFGRPSVSVLLKKHNDAVYLFAVNASFKSVKARIFVPNTDGEGEVLWENRRVKASAGAFEDEFKGFGVHVYRFD